MTEMTDYGSEYLINIGYSLLWDHFFWDTQYQYLTNCHAIQTGFYSAELGSRDGEEKYVKFGLILFPSQTTSEIFLRKTASNSLSNRTQKKKLNRFGNLFFLISFFKSSLAFRLALHRRRRVETTWSHFPSTLRVPEFSCFVHQEGLHFLSVFFFFLREKSVKSTVNHG